METLDVPQLIQRIAMAGQVAMLGSIILGAMLLLLGRRIARPGCAMLGLAAGGVTAMVLPSVATNTQLAPLLVVCGCVVGFVVAWLMFRIFMGLNCGILLAIALPIASLMWRDRLPPIVLHEPAAHQQAESAGFEPLSLFEPDVQEPPAETETSTQTQEQPITEELQNLLPFDDVALDGFKPEPDKWLKSEATEEVQTRVENQANAFHDWWDSIGRNGQKNLVGLAFAGVACGLLLGVIAPYWGAALFSSLLGSTMVILGGLGWLAIGKDASSLPSLPESSEIVLLIGLITIAGTLFQWIIWTRKTDK